MPSASPVLPLEKLVRATRVLAPSEAIVDPVFLGTENIPDDRPLLFVGNHTLWGVLDIPYLWAHLVRTRGIVMRGLGDHLHFRIPFWRDLVAAFGAVDGTRENTAALLRAGESVLVFPGGGREVAKRKGELYRLVWKDRVGFARLAIEHGATVVPFAAVGVEDAFDIAYDADDMLGAMGGIPGALVDALKIRRAIIPPFTLGLASTPLPRPERLYFSILPAIGTSRWAERRDDVTAHRELRDLTRTAVEEGIASLREYRARDPERLLRRRLLKAASRVMKRR